MPVVLLIAVIARLRPRMGGEPSNLQQMVDWAMFFAGSSVGFLALESLVSKLSYMGVINSRSHLTEYGVAADICIVLSFSLALFGRGRGRVAMLMGYSLFPLVIVAGLLVLFVFVHGFKHSSF